MVEGSTIAAVGVGGLVAAEAVGITNITGGGGSGGGESPLPPTLPGSGGPGLGELMAIAEGMNGAGESVTRVINTGGGESGGAAAGIASAFAQMQESQNETLATVLSETQGTTETVREYVPTNVGNTGPDSSDPNPGTGGNPTGVTDRQVAAHQAGRDPFGLQATTEAGSPIGQAAEALRAGGEAASAVGSVPGAMAGFAGKSGRTLGEAGRLLTTGKADTSGTLSEDRGEVGLDFSGDGEAGGKLTDRIPEMKLPEGTTDAMTAGLL